MEYLQAEFYQQILLTSAEKSEGQALSEMLKGQDIPHYLATDGISALRFLEKNPVDLAIIDYQMPYVDGLEISNIIRSKLGLSELPIILLHHEALSSSAEASCQELDIAAVGRKPLDAPQLYRLLHQAHSISEKDEPEQYEQRPPFGHILVVDDNPTNLVLLKTFIHKAMPEIEVVEAQNGQEALEKFRAHDISLVFMDIQMPVMSGYEATKTIRGLEKGKNIPIIAVTAKTAEGELRRCLEAGMDDCLFKPISFQTLEQKLNLWISEKTDPKRSSHSQHFDFAQLKEQMMGDANAISIMMEHLKADPVKEDLNALRTAVMNQEEEEVYEAAHRVKGTALTCSMPRLERLSVALEEVKPFDAQKAKELLHKIEEEHRYILLAIKHADQQ